MKQSRTYPSSSWVWIEEAKYVTAIYLQMIDSILALSVDLYVR